MKNNKTKIFVPMDTAAMSMGSNDVAEKIKSIAENQNKNIEIVRNGSWGMSWLEPLIEVCVDDERIAYGPVTVDDVVLTLGGDTAPTSDDGFDKGVEFRYFKPTHANPGGEALIGFMGYDESLNKFTMLTEARVSSGDYSGTAGNLVVGALQASSVTGATINGGTY